MGKATKVIMARNQVQPQTGLRLAELCRRYGRQEQCHAALVAMRWPEGFACPNYGGAKYSYSVAHRSFQCSACRKQPSARAGTIFHASFHASFHDSTRHSMRRLRR